MLKRSRDGGYSQLLQKVWLEKTAIERKMWDRVDNLFFFKDERSEYLNENGNDLVKWRNFNT